MGGVILGGLAPTLVGNVVVGDAIRLEAAYDRGIRFPHVVCVRHKLFDPTNSCG